ncbi:MAG: hypothetical protein PSU94_18270 [Lacunisphaera sp.]|nr:hypothetical protein [Lacunisphaera sp.]
MTAVEFTSILTDAATGALPYLAGGVAAGAVIFAVTLGLRKGVAALRLIGK